MKRAINLDSMFVPVAFRPEIEFENMRFNGGEVHIKLNNNINYDEIESVVITHRITDSDKLMEVLLAHDALKRKGVKKFDLVMPYIPYARQDRVCVNGESFSLKVFANLINSLKFDNVFVLDAHSGISPALIDGCVNISNENYVERAIADIRGVINKIVLVSPDSGANKKSNELFEKAAYFKSLVKCDKKRDVSNGKLSGFEVFCDDLGGAPCMIVDDICDGGGTFVGIAKELKKKNAGDIYLFVSHGIFSKGFDELAQYFKKIYTTNSFKDVKNELVTQFKIEL